MAINKKLITFDKKSTFLGANGINNVSSPTNGYYHNIPEWSMVFILETGEIWHNGKYFGRPIKDQIFPATSQLTKGIVFMNNDEYYYRSFNLWGNVFDGSVRDINGELVVQGETYKWTYGDSVIRKGNTNLIAFSGLSGVYDVFIPSGNLSVTGGDLKVGNNITLASTGSIKGTHILNTNSYFNLDYSLGKTWNSIKLFNTSGTLISLDSTRPAIINIQAGVYASGTNWQPWITGGDVTELSSWGIGLGGDAFYIGRISKSNTENSLSQYWKFDSEDGITISGTTKYIKVANLSDASSKIFMADGSVKSISSLVGIGEATTSDYGGFKLSLNKASSQQTMTASTTGSGRYAVKMNADGTLYVEFSQANTWKAANSSLEGYVPKSIAGKFLHANSKGNLEWIDDRYSANTDRTGIKLGTVSGTKKTDSTVIIASSDTGLIIQGGTNLFKIGNGTNYIEVPVTPSISNNVTGSGTSGKLVKWNGTNTITDGPALSSAVSSLSLSTKFLREDGTWAAPSYTALPTFYNLVFNNGSSDVFTYDPDGSASKKIIKGSNITFTVNGNNLTIAAVDTWKKNTATQEGYVTAPGANVSGKVWMTGSDGTPSWLNANNHSHSYLPLSGGTLNSGSMIVWQDWGQWGAENPTYPKANGGLQWSGTSDTIKLFAEETASNDLRLVLLFGDDNSPRFEIRDKNGNTNAYIATGGAANFTALTVNNTAVSLSGHKHAYTDLTGSGTTANQAIVSNGTANGWTLKTLGSNAFNSTAYLPLSGGTMSGWISFSNSSSLLWNNGTYRLRILLTDDSTADTAVFTFLLSTDSGSSWSNLLTIRDNSKIIATTFVGALSGNATSATNISGGAQGSISYLTAAGTTTFLSGGSNGQVLAYDATNKKPYWKTDSNTWTAWKGATSDANGTAGYMPAPTSALRNLFLRGDGSWVSLNNYSLPKATTSALGGIIVSNVLTTAVTLTSTNGATANRYYGVQLDKDGKAFVNIPWVWNAFTAATADAAGTAGYIQAPKGALSKFFRGDNTWLSITSNVTTSLYFGASNGTTNAEVAATPYIILKEGSSYTRYKLEGNGGITVSSDASGNVKFTGTTYSVFTGATADAAGSTGLVKQPAKGDQGKFLRGDCTWQSLTSNVTTALYVGASNGTSTAAQSTNGNVYLILKEGSSYTRYNIVGSGRASVTSDANGKITINSSGYSNFTVATADAAGGAGLVPGPGKNVLGSGGYFLRADATWAVPTNTWKEVSTSQEGYVPKIVTTGSLTSSDNPFILVYKNVSGTTKSIWVPLPANAFNNTWTAADFTNAGYVPKSVKGKFLHAKSDTGALEWVDDNNTWNAANNSQAGYVPKLTTGGGTIATQSTEYVLTFVSGGTGTITPTWKLLPVNAFNNTWTAWKGATDSANGTAGYMPAPTSAQKGQFLRGDGSWVSLNNYSLPTASNSKLGGVKTGAAITDTTGYTAVAIKDGVIYYKDTNTTYTFYNLLFQNSGGTTVDTYKPTTSPTKTLKAGNNVTISAASNVITIASTNTWNANAVGVAGYVAAPTKAANANMTWLTNAEGVPAWRASNNHSHSYLPLSGGTVSGTTLNFMRILRKDTTNSSAICFFHYSSGTTEAALGAIGFDADGTAKRWASDLATKYTILDSSNSSVSKSGETLTVKINGTSQSLTNTWRGIQNNLTSDSTTDSLSAAQGKALNGKFANYLPLSGGTMVGTISAANDAYGGGGFNNGYANIILRGNTTTGASGIVFSSSKGNTSINRPSDCAFIQFLPYGVSAATAVGTNPTINTSGEAGRFVIGIHNDSGDLLWLQTSAANDLKHVVGANVYTIYDSGNLPAYPTKSSWNYDDRYVSSLTTSGNHLRWVKNGSNNDITIPYATNADTVDNWHQSNLVWSGYVTSGTANLSSYWFKAWESTITDKKYNDLDLMLLVSSAYDQRRGLVHVRIRQNGENNGGAYNFTLGLWLVIGNIPLDKIRLYCNNSSGVCQLWMDVQGQYGVYNYTVLKKTWRTGNDITSFGTLTANSFSTAQSVPGLATGTCIQLSSGSTIAWDNVSSKPATATRWPSWSEVTSKPSSFTPSSHTHNMNDIKWPGGHNLITSATANGQEWSIDCTPGSYTGTYWLVWRATTSGISTSGTMLKVDCDTGKVSAPYGFVGNVTGNCSGSAGSVAWGNVSSKPAATGNATTPVYWNGSGFTLANSYPTKASWNYDDVYTKKTQAIPIIVGPSTDTTAGTWTGTTNAFSAYADGLTIIYVPAVAGAATTTLNINGLGAKTCYFTNTSKLTTHFAVGTPIMFTYYGGYWKRADYDSNSNTQYYLTLNGTVKGTAGKTNLGTFYAIATSDASAANQVWMRNSSNNGYAWRTLGSHAFDSTTYSTTDKNVKQTPKTDNVNRPLMMINGGTSAGEQTSTSMFSTGIYANASTKKITANGFIKNGSDSSHVLLGDGGHKALSDFAMSGHNHNSSYVTAVGNGSGDYINNLYYTLNGSNNYFTVNYATNSNTSNVALSLLTNDTAQNVDNCYNGAAGLHFYKKDSTTSTKVFTDNTLTAVSSTGGTNSGGDGFILQWSWSNGSVGLLLYLDDNPSGIMAIRGYLSANSTNGTVAGFTKWMYILNSSNWSSYITVGNGTLNLLASGVTKTTFKANATTDSTFNIATGSTNGTISVGGADVAVKGLGSRAYDSTAYLPLAGGTMTGALTVKLYILGYNYNHAGGNAPAFIFDKPGDNYTGIGAHSTSDTIWFGAATISNGEASWVDSYKLKWVFNGTVTSDTFYGSLEGNATTATSAGNADTVDNLHASNLVRFFLSPLAADGPADSAKSWFTETMPSASGAIVYNVPGSEKTIIAGKSSGAHGHMLQLNYDDNYLRLLRYRGGSWQSTDWEKISAGYADSAGSASSVPWSGITGKPTSKTVWGQTYCDSNGDLQSVTGRIYLPENTPHYFRDPSNTSWRGGFIWGTSNYECLSFVAVSANTKYLFVCGSDIASWDLHTYASASYALEIRNTGTYAPNFYTTSDRSKKQNISSFSDHIRKFQLKDTEKWHYGVIALEVEEMFRDGEEGNMTVNYNSILSFYIGLLENRVKELEEKIKLLEIK